MYLTKLSKEQKELFLGLAYELSNVDGNFSEAEKEIIDEYCHEMKMEFNKETMVMSSDKLIDRINDISNEMIKKIVIFEIVGLAMVDKKYDAKEREFIKRMEETFGIDSGFGEKCEMIINEYIAFQMKINQLVLGE